MNELSVVSNGLVSVVESVGPSVVRVEGRPRLPGSGVAWSVDGLIVTADHVVERDEDITIGLPEGQTTSATLVGRDPATDLAVLRAQVPLKPPAWAESGGVRVGQLVLAVTRPGRTARAALGIVSAVGGNWRTSAGGEIDSYLQADVELSVGFSGGLLADVSGKVLGLTTAGLERRAALAIPAPTLRRVVEAIATHGRVRRGYLGISGHPVRLPDPIGRQLGQRLGLILISVELGSPADRGGLFVGDVVVAIDQTPMRYPGDVAVRLDEASIGKLLSVRVLRAGQLVDLTLTAEARP